MTLPASGTISISSLRTEFSTSAQSLSQFYRGGGIVPNIAQNNNVPTSGTISLSNFYNATSTLPANPTNATLNITGSTMGPVNPATANVSNVTGDSPFTYSWNHVSGGFNAVLAVQGTSSASWTSSASLSSSETWNVTVTGNTGQVWTSSNFTLNIDPNH